MRIAHRMYNSKEKVLQKVFVNTKYRFQNKSILKFGYGNSLPSSEIYFSLYFHKTPPKIGNFEI